MVKASGFGDRRFTVKLRPYARLLLRLSHSELAYARSLHRQPDSFQQPLSFFVRRSAYTLTSAGSDPATGADAGIRTPNLMITRHLLCRLSYIGLSAGAGSLSDLNPPGGLSQTANVSAAPCWMPPEDGAVGEG